MQKIVSELTLWRGGKRKRVGLKEREGRGDGSEPFHGSPASARCIEAQARTPIIYDTETGTSLADGPLGQGKEGERQIFPLTTNSLFNANGKNTVLTSHPGPSLLAGALIVLNTFKLEFTAAGVRTEIKGASFRIK
jgi:hypothetical protein